MEYQDILCLKKKLFMEGGYVAKGCLPRSVCPPAPNTGDTSDSAAGAPGLGARLVSCDGGHGVRLTLVLANVGVHKLNWRDREREGGGAK